MSSSIGQLMTTSISHSCTHSSSLSSIILSSASVLIQFGVVSKIVAQKCVGILRGNNVISNLGVLSYVLTIVCLETIVVF
jgi:hypothetical protein